MNPRQLIAVLLARAWVVALVFGVCVALAVGVTLALPKTYTAAATLVIEPKMQDVLGAPTVSSQVFAQTYLATQLDILQSQSVALRVVRDLQLAKNPQAQAQFMAERGGRGNIEDYFAALLKERLDVKPSRESMAVTISFSGAEPQFAATVANAFAQAFMTTNLELRLQPAKQYASFFDDQLKTLRTQLEQAQRRLSEYQRANGIVATDERFDIENSRLQELSQQLSLAQSQGVEARSKASEGGATATSVPDVSLSPVVQGLRAELARAEARLEELSAQYGPGHPTYQRAQREADALRARVASELENASRSINAVSRAGGRREADLRSAVAVQRERVLRIKEQRDEMAVLVHEVDNAQHVFDLALQRFAQSSLESQNNQSYAYLLTAATPPATPSRPKPMLNLAIGALLGAMLGIVVAIALEALARKVRVPDDLALDDGVPLLGMVPREASGWWQRIGRRLAWRRARPALGLSA